MVGHNSKILTVNWKNLPAAAVSPMEVIANIKHGLQGGPNKQLSTSLLWPGALKTAAEVSSLGGSGASVMGDGLPGRAQPRVTLFLPKVRGV